MKLMDRWKRTILKRSLIACAAAATVGASGRCLAQVTPSPSAEVGPAVLQPPRPSRSVPVDVNVQQAHLGVSYPSLQQPAEVPAAPQKAQPPAPQAPVAPQTPMYAPQAPTYAPQMPVYAPQYPMYAPQYMPMAPQFAPQAPAAGNFFLPQAAPTAMAPMAPAAMPMAPMVPAMAMAPAALTSSAVSVPTSRTSTSLRVRGPGPLALGLSRIGERLVQLGRTRIESVQETVLDTPNVHAGGGLATISTSGLAPVPQPPAAPPAAQPPAAPPASPQAPTPSPQDAHPHHHKKSFMEHVFGH
jgi:hypothetical protein